MTPKTSTTGPNKPRRPGRRLTGIRVKLGPYSYSVPSMGHTVSHVALHGQQISQQKSRPVSYGCNWCCAWEVHDCSY